MSNENLNTPAPLANNLSTCQVSTNALVHPNISLLARISSGNISLSSAANGIGTLTQSPPLGYAGA